MVNFDPIQGEDDCLSGFPAALLCSLGIDEVVQGFDFPGTDRSDVADHIKSSKLGFGDELHDRG